MDLVKNASATKRKGAQNWAYKRTLNGADYNTDGVRQIAITAAGSGYVTAPAVSFTLGSGDTTGLGAAATAVLTGGVVTAINITEAGTGYTVTPTVVIGAPPGGGVQATATASLVDIWHDGILRKSSEQDYDEPVESDELEGGIEGEGETGKMTATFKFVFGQDDENTIKFLMREAHRYELSIFYEKGKSINSTTQQFFIPITKWPRKYGVKSGERRPEVTIKPRINLTAVTPSNIPTWAKGIAADWTVPAEQYFEVQDN
jgi:hypothetical protein